MKPYFILLITTITASPLIAQKISIGGEAGFVSSITTRYKVTDFDNRRNTYYLGLNLNYHHTEKLTFSTGIHFLQQGYKHETCYIFEEGVKNELVGQLDYLIMPLVLTYGLGKSNRLVTTVGFYGGMNVNATQNYPEPIGGCKIYYARDISNARSKVILGGIVGFGFKLYEDQNISLYSLLKYYQGFSNSMSNNHDFDIVWKDRSSAALMTLTLGYKL